MKSLFQATGAAILNPLQGLGRVVVLAGEACASIFQAKIRWNLVVAQIVEIGFRSQLVVIVTGCFTGAVFAAQTFFQFNRLGMASAVGAVVAVSLCRELAPVLTGLMVAGRVGAAMSAEIGTMKVTEQIDALRALAVHPVDYLVAPRVLAMMISMPLLAAQSIGLGILTAYGVGVSVLGIQHAYFMDNMMKFTDGGDLIMGVTKAFVFGLIIVMVGCQRGLDAKDGAVGVGRATTDAVVVASLAILISNFFLTMLLNMIFPAGAQL